MKLLQSSVLLHTLYNSGMWLNTDVGGSSVSVPIVASYSSDIITPNFLAVNDMLLLNELLEESPYHRKKLVNAGPSTTASTCV